jgi:predicted protein tyrosine phosphatase
MSSFVLKAGTVRETNAIVIAAGRRPSITILNRPEAEAFVSDEPYAILGATDPHEQNPSYRDSDNLRRVLNLNFNDIRHQCCERHRLFEDAHATDIVAFAEWVRDSGVSTLIVHCEAGISRSSAIAVAIGRYLGADIDDILDPTKRYRPNTFVFWRLARALMPGREAALVDELFQWIALHAPEMAEAMGPSCIDGN